jgi:MoaA/NifB/PqqE/SkfB family radical SAM enzyme
MNAKEMLQGGSDSEFLHNRFHVLINVCDRCNLHCSYCINSKNVVGGKRILDINLLAGLLESIVSQKSDSYYFGIAGGEPFLYPYLIKFVKIYMSLFQKTYHKFMISTNMTTSYRKIIKYFEHDFQDNLHLLVSVHLEEINIDTYVRNIACIPKEMRKKMKFKVLLREQNVNRALYIINALEDQCINKIMVSLIQDNTGKMIDAYNINITQEQKAVLDLLQKYPHGTGKEFFCEYAENENRERTEFGRNDFVLDPSLINFNGLWCTAGMNTLRVGPDGMVRRCFGLPEELHISAFQDQFPDAFLSPVRCPVKRCGCGAFLASPKWRTPQDAPTWLPDIPAPGVPHRA